MSLFRNIFLTLLLSLLNFSHTLAQPCDKVKIRCLTPGQIGQSSLPPNVFIKDQGTMVLDFELCKELGILGSGRADCKKIPPNNHMECTIDPKKIPLINCTTLVTTPFPELTPEQINDRLAFCYRLNAEIKQTQDPNCGIPTNKYPEACRYTSRELDTLKGIETIIDVSCKGAGDVNKELCERSCKAFGYSMVHKNYYTCLCEDIAFCKKPLPGRDPSLARCAKCFDTCKKPVPEEVFPSICKGKITFPYQATQQGLLCESLATDRRPFACVPGGDLYWPKPAQPLPPGVHISALGQAVEEVDPICSIEPVSPIVEDTPSPVITPETPNNTFE